MMTSMIRADDDEIETDNIAEISNVEREKIYQGKNKILAGC